jgi:hypothetical protein
MRFGIDFVGAWTVAPAADRKLAEEGFKEEGVEGRDERVAVDGTAVDVHGGGGGIWGIVVRGGDSLALFACDDEGEGRTELAHVFEHDAVVGCVEGVFEVRVHDVDVFIADFGFLHHHDDGCVVHAAEEGKPFGWSPMMP